MNLDFLGTINNSIIVMFMTIMLSFFYAQSLLAKTIKIAVIDTGFNMNMSQHVKLCPKEEHKDFTGNGINDINGHGTNIAGLIAKGNENIDYCLLIINFYDETATGKVSLLRTIDSLKYALKQNVDIINLSMGGGGTNKTERQLIKTILNKNIKIVAAAGNEGNNLDEACIYYPACYDERIHIIGNTSNGNMGEKVIDEFIDGNKKEIFGITLSGSSQSAAIFTNRLLKNYKRNEK